MNNNPLVSIIIPVYNVEKYIEECLTSCISQSYENIEIIVINDGSPDGSGDIIERFRQSDCRITHLRQENKGLPKSRIRGIKESHGDLIMHVDGDDFIDVRCVELMVAKMVETNADMVYADAYSWSPRGEKSEIKLNPKKLNVTTGTEFLVEKLPTFLWAKMYKSGVMGNLIPQSVNVSEDVFFNLQILPRCGNVVYLEENVYYYRTNEASIMFGKRSGIAKEYLIHANERKILCDKPTYPQSIKDMLAFDNISVIYRYLENVGVDAQITEFIAMSFRDYKFRVPKTVKIFRMQLFLLASRVSPTIACKVVSRH